VTEAEAEFSDGEAYLSGAATALATGDYPEAGYDDLVGSFLASAVPVELLLIGAASGL
jgi:hypothetical protein